jgi:serine/threonine protein kinase/TolB-like protein
MLRKKKSQVERMLAPDPRAANWNIERWSEISPLLDQALELHGDERRDWLDRLDASRPDIALKVRGLLSRHEANRAAGFLEQSPLQASEANEPEAGEQVGAYTLVHLLGRGGMGTVWLARRSDGRFEGKVAIKILRRCGLGRDAADQLRREASSLARLSHPNVARLLDAGIRDDGRPFLILEYVEGERIDEYCSRTALELAERLRLLLPAIDAVAHAHANGIVHRDIKPSNILVTSRRVPKLLDFGVAALRAETSAQMQGAPEGEPTGMTLGYAAPEQVRGETATAATDVYALGILLYVLITDRHPHGVDSSTPTQLIEATLTSDCKRASDSIDSTTLRRWVRGDLDSIIAKATQREAGARYANATQLAEDIRRFLESRPVRARAPTFGYQAALYARRLAGWQPGSSERRRRTRGGALLAGVLLFSIACGSVWMDGWNRGAQATRQPAASLIGHASIAVLPFNDLSTGKDAEYFSDGLSEGLLDRLAHTTDLRVIARTSSFQFKDRQADARSIARALAVAYLLQGSVRKSGDLLHIGVQLVRGTDGAPIWLQTYERKLDDIFNVQTEIAAQVAQVLNVTPRNAAPGSESPTPKVAAYNLVLQGNFFKSRATRLDTERAMSLYNQAIGLDPHYALPWALLGEGYFMETNRDWIGRADGLALARAALARSLEMEPNLIWAHYMLANIATNIELDWAAAHAEVERMRQLEPGSSVPLLAARADIEASFGRLEPAIKLYQAALSSDPLNTITLSGLAYAQYAAGRTDASLVTVRRLLELAPDFVGAHVQLGIYLLSAGQQTQALAAVQQERDESDRLFALPIMYWAAGQHDSSNAALTELSAKHAGDDAYGIACVYASRGETELALQWLERAYRQRDMSLALLKIDPLLHSLRGDPRYQALLRRLKLSS